MESWLLDVVCCPLCRGVLVAEAPGARCGACGEVYPLREGILDLHPSPSAESLQEMAAHEAMEAKWLDEIVPAHLHDRLTGEAGNRLHWSFPRVEDKELAAAVPQFKRLDDIAQDYFELLDWLRLERGDVVVEVGAHMGWSARHLAERAGRVVATDISPHLVSAKNYWTDKVRFECVYSNMATFPFRDNSLDLIFAVASIHHLADLTSFFKHCRRALRPGGRAVFFAEPVAGRWDTEARERFGAEEKAMGIQEHIYSIGEYFAAARGAGLTPGVVPMTSLMRDPRRNWPWLRRIGLWLIESGLGRRWLFRRVIYRLMLVFYPRIPFPHFAFVLTNPR
ncbi:MAG TPA: methyltransferase domain-containing protein [Candidatus Bathyarchaeia archaeon]|nr:methyltransferase domain-containing protein [Candidatus Bathyarchaeia archaeon]